MNEKMDLQITILTPDDQERMKTNYKYLIKNGCYPYTAYITDKGFNDFLKRGSLELIKSQYHNNIYTLNKVVTEKLIRKLSDIENIENCIKFIGLSNGSYVTCYQLNKDDEIIIYLPNPNDKDIYQPLPIKEHIEHSKMNG